MKKNKPHKKSFIKKSLKNFMKDESGNMTKENILKMGLGTVVALSMFSGISSGQPCTKVNNWSSHLSDNTLQWDGPDAGQKQIIPSHSHHTNHCSY